MTLDKALLWVGFHLVIFALLAVDLGLASRGPAAVTARRATLWTLLWTALSLAFCGGLWLWMGKQQAGEFLAGYVVEYSLSVDNLFVFLLLFSAFRIAREFQHRLLFWGVLGQFAMRAPLIILGAKLVQSVSWVFYVFGVFLLYTAGKTFFAKHQEAHPESGWVMRWARRLLPVSEAQAGSQFLVREAGRLKVTPMFLVLVVINVTDLMFALDSIPAVLGVTQDPFIAYTSNVCAIFGLRSLFFVVASLMDKFHYLQAGVSVILAFVGLKMCVSHWYEVSIGASLAFIGATLAVAIVASALRGRTGVVDGGSGR